ncbi:MAG: SDR family oxidoreductase [Myxococcales bacterium]|nr:SDR family oxidoreductase [Myxococcales bacterium]
MRYFKDKKVFITGGSSGIGKSTAALLARNGANVIIGARNEAKLETALGQIEAVADSAEQITDKVVIDIADKASVSAARDAVLERLGGLDVLINNAGIAQPGYVQELSDDVFEQQMRVNYFGTVNVTRAFLPTFVEQHSGHICNVSSLLGFMGVFGYTAYAASKFAVVGFSDCLRQELLPHGVGVSVVYPADVDTPQLAEENQYKPAETKAVSGNVKVMHPDAVAEAMLKGIASGRYNIVPGFGSKFTHFMYRHFPWMVRATIDGDVKKATRARNGNGA